MPRQRSRPRSGPRSARSAGSSPGGRSVRGRGVRRGRGRQVQRYKVHAGRGASQGGMNTSRKG
eukprot:4749975-Prymnesium_polylepis.1